MKSYSTNFWIWLLIITFGFSTITSFYTVSFKGFDGWFFLIMVCYIIISQVTSYFVEKAIVNSSGRVSKARMALFQEFELIDKNGLWEDIISLDKTLQYLYLFSWSLSIYKCYCLNNEIGEQFSEADVRLMIMEKSFSRNLKQQGIDRKLLSKIKKEEKTTYKGSYFWRKQYNKFKNGALLNQQKDSPIYALFSILLGIASIITSIVLTVNVLPNTKIAVKLVFIIVFFVADSVGVVLNARSTITHEETQSKSIIEYIESLLEDSKMDVRSKMCIDAFLRCEKGTTASNSGKRAIEKARDVIKSINPNFVND